MKMDDEEGKYQIDYTLKWLGGACYYLPNYAMHRPAVQRVLRGELHEPQTHALIAKIFSSFSGSMVHAGTFFGDMLPAFSTAVSGIVYAFEPVLENYILARLCIERNGLNNVQLYNCALSDVQGNLRINIGEGETMHRGGSSSIEEDGKLCSALRVDDFDYEDLVVIQLDVEGHELAALKGAEKSICKFRPIILIEDNNNACTCFLEEKGYQFIRRIPGLSAYIHKATTDKFEKLLLVEQ